MKAAFTVLAIVAMFVGVGQVWAAPPAPAGTLVYEDDFSDPSKSGLDDNVSATDYQRGFHAPGYYHLRLLKNDDTRFSLFPNQSYGEFSAELDLWDNSDEFAGDVSEGLVFRATDSSHMYAAMLDQRKGQYAVRKLNGATWSDIIAWKPSALLKEEPEVNHLRVDGNGTKFTIYLNGETLDTFNDSSYSQGSLGLIASNVDATMPHLHFDNLRVYTTEVMTTQGQGGTQESPEGSLPDSGKPDSMGAIAALLAAAMLGSGLWLRKRRYS